MEPGKLRVPGEIQELVREQAREPGKLWVLGGSRKPTRRQGVSGEAVGGAGDSWEQRLRDWKLARSWVGEAVSVMGKSGAGQGTSWAPGESGCQGKPGKAVGIPGAKRLQ